MTSQIQPRSRQLRNLRLPLGEDDFMDGKVRVVTLAIVHLVLGGLPRLAAGGEPATEGEVLVARLVHPDRQAAEVLRLFEGARWSDPAAALAAWKQQSPESGLSKPLEAVI